MATAKLQKSDGTGDVLLDDDLVPARPGSRFDSTDELHMGRVTHTRNGLIVVDHPIDTRQRWDLNIKHCSQAEMLTVRAFYVDGTFRYYPDKDVATYYDVKWDADDFVPRLEGGGQYSFTIPMIEY